NFPGQAYIFFPAEHINPPMRRSLRDTDRDVSGLVNAATYRGVIELFAVHLLRLDLLAHRVDEFVVLPERGLLGGELDTLLDVELAVDVPRIAHVLADKLFVRAVGQNLAVKLVDHDVEI